MRSSNSQCTHVCILYILYMYTHICTYICTNMNIPLQWIIAHVNVLTNEYQKARPTEAVQPVKLLSGEFHVVQICMLTLTQRIHLQKYVCVYIQFVTISHFRKSQCINVIIIRSTGCAMLTSSSVQYHENPVHFRSLSVLGSSTHT